MRRTIKSFRRSLLPWLLLLVTVSTMPAQDAAIRDPLEVSATSIKHGESLTITAKVSPKEAPGYVNFYSDGKGIGRARLDEGTARLETKKLPVGSDRLRAVYEGTSKYASSKSRSVWVEVKTALKAK